MEAFYDKWEGVIGVLCTVQTEMLRFPDNKKA